MQERLAALKADGQTAQYWETVPNLILVGDRYETADGTEMPRQQAEALVGAVDPASWEPYPPPATPTETTWGITGVHDPHEIIDVPAESGTGVKGASHGSNPIQRR
jgi:hypothetical protein